jgi:hypothetical protein
MRYPVLFAGSLTVTSDVMTQFLLSWRAAVAEHRLDLSKMTTLEVGW